MKAEPQVQCRVTDLDDSSLREEISFSLGRQLKLHLRGIVGAAGLSDEALDMIELGAAIFRIEQQIHSRRLVRRPKRYQLSMGLRHPGRWSPLARSTLVQLLQHMSNSIWSVEFRKQATPVQYYCPSSTARVRQLALFSGGLDSACGAGTLLDELDHTLFVGYYTRQKKLQASLAEKLGIKHLFQSFIRWHGPKGAGRSFYYRSFFFLSLAAGIAQSYGAKKILQFENGVLANAIAPAESLVMTRHASPGMQRLAMALFSEVLGGDWKIENPFVRLTKKQILDLAVERSGRRDLPALFAKTETCWGYNAITSLGRSKSKGKSRRKRRGLACGRCIPCIVRHPAFPDESVAVDLRKDRNRNHPQLGAFFRNYVGFLERTIKAKSADEFYYHVLSAEGREVLEDSRALTREEIWKLFRVFAGEFFSSYRLRL